MAKYCKNWRNDHIRAGAAYPRTVHKEFGGGSGIREEFGLLAALAQPYATFGGALLYQSVFEEAAAIGERIIMNHPFVDGNKRTDDAHHGAGWLLGAGSTTGNVSIHHRFDKAVEWLRGHCLKR